MKVKRYKHARRILSFYKNNFGIHEPYQVLVDGTFCRSALAGKIQIKEQLPKYFAGEVQLVTTRCVVQELSSLGRELMGASYVAKRFQERRCGHPTKKAKPAAECILSLVGEANHNGYFVASQDPELRSKLRRIPGVPLMHIVRNTMVLEEPSGASQHKSQELSMARVKPTEYEQSVIDALNAEAPQQPGSKKRRKKRAKGPNPLSVKKSQKFSFQDRPSTAGVASKSKKRRLRLQRTKAVQMLAQVIQSTVSAEDDRTKTCTISESSNL